MCTGVLQVWLGVVFRSGSDVYRCVTGVGGIEAEAVMLGQAISMVLPQVIGYKITGTLDQLTTSTDVVLTVTKVRLIF